MDIRTVCRLVVMGALAFGGCGRSQTVVVPKAAGRSWPAAVTYICGGEATEAQIGKLRQQGEESMGRRCETPMDCDPRPYNLLREDVQVTAPFPLELLCGRETAPAAGPQETPRPIADAGQTPAPVVRQPDAGQPDAEQPDASGVMIFPADYDAGRSEPERPHGGHRRRDGGPRPTGHHEERDAGPRITTPPTPTPNVVIPLP